MHNFMTFVGKEFTETLRTKRLIILACVFAFVAFISPMMARFMMEIITLAVPAEEMAEMMDMLAAIPDPHWSDSYGFFNQNMAQFGVFAIILLFMGAILDEKRRGTAALMMMKGLNHTRFVFAKFSVASLVIFITLVMAVLINHLYTYILFEEAAAFGDVMWGLLAYQLFAMFMLAITYFFSTIAKSAPTAAIFSILAFMILAIVSVMQNVGDASPYVMGARSLELTLGFRHDWLIANILASIGATIALLLVSIHILKKKEL